jgi:2-polyprenyl-6-methoxyphenol hydroxylase-like FAD-dependent oxidoreductase
MATTDGTRAIVIGAGIGGLSSAIALRRLGMEVLVYERQPQLTEVGSGLTLWTNAMRALDQLGVGGAIAERGARVDEIRNWNYDGGPLKTLPIARVAEKYGQAAYGLHRADLQQGLAGALPEGSIRRGMTCIGYRQDADGVTGLFDDGSEDHGALLVGADGLASAVRTTMLGQAPPRYAGYTCWRSSAFLEHDLLRPTSYIQLYGHGSNFGIFPVGAGRWSWYGTQLTGPTTMMVRGPAVKDEALEAFHETCPPVTAVIEATKPDDCVRQDIYDRKPVATWTDGRVTLLGDAAHPTTPALGQGGCMAVEDAVALERQLSLGGEIPTALRRFNALRRERTTYIVNQARLQGRLYHGGNRRVRAVRQMMLGKAPVAAAMRVVDRLMGYEA